MNAHYCTIENAPRMWNWIKNHGGVAVWRTCNLSNPGESWSTPADLGHKPHPYAEPTPSRIITDPDEIWVAEDREVRRFKVHLRMGRQGFLVKLTDKSSSKLKLAVERAGEGAYHRFDYETQEAVIYAPVRVITLTQWAAELTTQPA